MTAARRAGNQVQCGRTVEQAGTAELARSEEGRSPFVSAGDGCGDLEREREECGERNGKYFAACRFSLRNVP